jgi:hypothetical protein
VLLVLLLLLSLDKHYNPQDTQTMADPYKFSFDVAAFLEEQEAADTSVAPKEGVMKKPEAPVEVAPMSNADRLKKRFADTVNGFYSSTQDIRDTYNKAQETNPLFGRKNALDQWEGALLPFPSPVTVDSLAPMLDTAAPDQPETPIIYEKGATVTNGRDSAVKRRASSGLMSPSVQDTVSEIDTDTAEAMPEATETADDTTFVSSFVDLMGTAEGTEDHQGSEDQFTYAYGILPATADSYGLNADDFENRRDFAEAVYAKMYEDAKTDYADTFDGLTTEEEKGVLSLYINLGKLPTGVVNALSGETKDFDAAKDSLASVVHYTNKTTKVKYASKGLSVRRASEYNTLRGSQEGFEPVATVSVTGTKAKPVFNWLDESGSTIKSFASSKTLSPDNSMKTTAVN